ncbi:UvrD-helicase domain-containing protein, partial [Stenotrophomonas maltophilia]
QWQEADWEKLRKQYVDRQLARNSAFFDTVESQPLTERQRVACVVDEDNNLVLAGAGTGKTSTMVGRAGFLMASGQARAADILMLAFAN